MLRTRLYLGLLPFLLLLVGTGGYSVLVSRQLAGSIQRDLVADYGAVLASQRMREAATQMSGAAARAEHGDPFGARRAFAQQRSAFTHELMAQSASAAGRPRAPTIETLDRVFQAYAAQAEASLLAGGPGTPDSFQRSEVALYRVLSAIEELNRRDYASALQTAARAERLAARTLNVLLGGMVSALMVSVILAWRLSVFLMQPLKELTATVAAIGEGDLDREVTERSRDELGQLARAFNQMSAKLRAYREVTLAKVLRTQRTMEATLTSAPDPVFVLDVDGTHTVRNPAAERLAQSPDFPAQFPPGIAEPLAQVLATGDHYLPTDYRHVVTFRVAREERHYLPRILAIGDKVTDFKGAAIILQDVTKFRLLDDAKTNLAGTVSHELKTPLTSLRLAVYLLLEENVGKLAPAQRELLETARDDADRLLRILDTLLDLARLEAGATALDRVETKVPVLLAEIAAEARGFIALAGATLEVECGAGLGHLSIDPARIRHVFINLLSNAAKFSPPGGVIRLSASSAPLGFVRFSVRDNGPGISSESLARVFDRFYRAPGQTKSGAGLGLAIAREIIVAHGGSIACTSEPGQGTDFHFLLPG
jgi:NtrC-family two-component system sensor histidine kinase KinB